MKYSVLLDDEAKVENFFRQQIETDGAGQATSYLLSSLQNESLDLSVFFAYRITMFALHKLSYNTDSEEFNHAYREFRTFSLRLGIPVPDKTEFFSSEPAFSSSLSHNLSARDQHYEKNQSIGSGACINSIGRRKTAVARIYMKSGKGDIKINGRDYKEYFPFEVHQIVLKQPFAVTEGDGRYDVKVNVRGGGISGQAEAIRLAMARALVEFNADYRTPLKREGFLTRDPRMVERKKYGRLKARRKFQFSKR